jgi:Leucine-rich repeat (LRR) protein
MLPNNSVVDMNDNRTNWVLLEDGAMKGMNIIVDAESKEVVSLSTRNCRDTERWRYGMPELTGFPNLQNLDLDNSRYVTDLHASVGSLQNLRKLCLTRCDRLERLPDSLCRLNKLEELVLTDTPLISSLPEQFGNLTR